jgi:ubiquinone/menaquinone biosynthesis C-methylase UbiE
VGNEYVWGSSDQERQRLASQAESLRPGTEKLFRAAGIRPGMHVLDCGSGGGDVSLIAADLVTSSGQVLGIDRDPAHIEAASRRVEDLGLTHVRFETGDISNPPEGPFDAIVGRLVLMYQSDVEAVLSALADRLESGGVMAFMEYEHTPPNLVPMWPQSPLVDQLMRWTDAAFEVLGNQARMGTRLPSLFRSIGLEPQPPYEFLAAVYTGDTVLQHEVTLMANIAPLLIANGIATEDEIGLDTFAERVKAELGPDPIMVGSGPSLAVWARKP